jgi:hypothetical protein
LTDSEQRSSPRYACMGQVAIDRAPGAKPLAGRLIDLSIGGCRIAPGISGDFRINREIEFVLERDVTVFRIRGAVRSTNQDTGEIGIQFTGITQRGRAALEEMIDELKQSNAHDRNVQPRFSLYN